MKYCKICSNQNLKKIVDNLRENGLSYREISNYLLEKFNVKVSLWSLSNHFWHTQPHSNIPKLEEDEIILDKTTLDKIINLFMEIFRRYVRDGDSTERFLNFLTDYMKKEPEPKLETNKTVYDDLRKIISNSSLEEDVKARMLEGFNKSYSQIIKENQTTS
jgi:hypothetical protein